MNKQLSMAVFICTLSGFACDEAAKRTSVSEKSACKLSSDCAPSERCEHGGCVAQQGCRIEGCAAGEICANDNMCQNVQEICANGGCRCFVVGLTGAAAAGDVPAFVVPPGTAFTPRVVYISQAGRLMPLTTGFFEVLDSSSFTVQGGQLMATSEPGTAQFTATSGNVSCTAKATNLGPAPAGRLRFRAFDQSTGQGVGEARVTVQVGPVPNDVGQAPNTTSDGISTYPAPLEQASYSVTVMAPGYHYLTVAGLQSDVTDIALPLKPLQTKSAGFSGDMDFASYEAMQNDGSARGVRTAMGGASTPLDSLMSVPWVDTTSLSGGLTPGEEPGCSMQEPGCISLQLTLNAGEPIQIQVPTPQALLLETPAEAQSVSSQPFFDVAARPGQSLPYVLGGELDIMQALRLEQGINPLVLSLLHPEADVNSSWRTTLETFVSLLPNMALGLGPVSDLQAVTLATWSDYTANRNFNDRPANSAFMRLTGSAGSSPAMQLTSALAQFTDLQMPNFPSDGDLDTVLVLGGAIAPGLGMVPLGIGFGVDCLDGACFRLEEPHTGVVQGMQLRDASSLARADRTADGHVAFFHALPFGGLEALPRKTVALAVSLRRLIMNDGLQISGVILDDTPQGASSQTLAQAVYPLIPVVPGKQQGRIYALAPDTDGSKMHVLRIGGLQTSKDEPQGTTWQIYVAGGVSEVYLPKAPVDWEDISTSVPLPVSHLAVQLDGASLQSLMQDSAASLASFAQHVRSFAGWGRLDVEFM